MIGGSFVFFREAFEACDMGVLKTLNLFIVKRSHRPNNDTYLISDV